MGIAKKVLEYVGKKASNYSKKKDKISADKTRKKLDILEQKQIAKDIKLDEKILKQKIDFQDLVIKSNPKAAKDPKWVKQIRKINMKEGGRIVGRPISKLSTSKRRQFGRKLEGPPPRRQTESEKRRGVPTEEQLRRMKARQESPKRKQFRKPSSALKKYVGKKPRRGLKEGGMVKKCRMDGIALRGKTRAKERSK